MTALRKTGHYTATVSSFGERHAAWHWYAGYNEIINPGYAGMDRADQVMPLAMDWIERKGRSLRDFFLHINLWDPHTPYRTPSEFGDPFAGTSSPSWFTEELFQEYRRSYGPHSTREPNGFYDIDMRAEFPLVPVTFETIEDVHRWFEAYDLGVRFADFWIARLIAVLKDAGIYDDCLVMVSADHGENLGELNIWGDHHTADQITCRVPLIVRMPHAERAGRVDEALHYHFDWAATVIELSGGAVPRSWDGVSFASGFRAGRESGREFIVTSQGAWACQRGVRFTREGHNYFWLETYHDGYKRFPPSMLFDLDRDPHETTDIADREPQISAHAAALLVEWQRRMMILSEHDVDPLMTVMREGGPFHCQGSLPAYIERLRKTGRSSHAALLAEKYAL
jgi:arylsulfatase A-like enzyme